MLENKLQEEIADHTHDLEMNHYDISTGDIQEIIEKEKAKYSEDEMIQFMKIITLKIIKIT